MNNLKELVTHLKSLDNGASMGELCKVFPDISSLKQFLKSGLEQGVIVKDGEKRGTRYYIKDKFIPQDKKNEVDDSDLEHNTLEEYLNSSTPISGQALITDMTKFGRPNEESLKYFLNAGIVIENTFVQYDKTIKKNVVIEKMISTQYNKIKIGWRDNMFTFTRYDTHTNKLNVESFKLYEDLRELIRGLT